VSPHLYVAIIIRAPYLFNIRVEAKNVYMTLQTIKGHIEVTLTHTQGAVDFCSYL